MAIRKLKKSMRVILFFRCALFLILSAACMCRMEARPNVIVIFTDDQGYADLGVHGLRDDVKTPHLDQLARNGVIFTDAYVTAPQCSPSRAALMTGRYQQRFGFDSIPDGPLPLEEKTIADRMSAAGYSTGMVGKWHLDPNAVSHAWAKRQDPPLEVLPTGSLRVPSKWALVYGPGARGFRDFYWGELSHYWRNYDLEGCSLTPHGEAHVAKPFHVDEQTAGGPCFSSSAKRRHAVFSSPCLPRPACAFAGDGKILGPLCRRHARTSSYRFGHDSGCG